MVVKCTLGIVCMDFFRLKQKFPDTLGVWIVSGRGSGICSAFYEDGDTDLIPMQAGVGCTQFPGLHVETADPGSLLESRSEVRLLLCTYIWRSLCNTFWEFFDSRRKKIHRLIYRLSIWIQLFRRSDASPWYLNTLQLYKSFPCTSFCFWDYLSMLSETSRISWHGFFQLIIYYSAKLPSGTPPCLIAFYIHTWSKKKIPCPSQLLAVHNFI